MRGRAWKLVCGAAIILALSLGLAGGSGNGGLLEIRSAETAETPNDFVYQLQRIDLSALRKIKFDL